MVHWALGGTSVLLVSTKRLVLVPSPRGRLAAAPAAAATSLCRLSSTLRSGAAQHIAQRFAVELACAAPRSNISHPEKEQVVATPVLRLFSRAQVISIGHEYHLLASGKIVRAVTSCHGHSHVSRVWWAGQ